MNCFCEPALLAVLLFAEPEAVAIAVDDDAFAAPDDEDGD